MVLYDVIRTIVCVIMINVQSLYYVSYLVQKLPSFTSDEANI